MLGITGIGKLDDISPNFVAIVATWILKNFTKTVVKIIATNAPGIFFVIFGKIKIIKTVKRLIEIAYGLMLLRLKK
jgi:hypothetical protein